MFSAGAGIDHVIKAFFGNANLVNFTFHINLGSTFLDFLSSCHPLKHCAGMIFVMLFYVVVVSPFQCC